MLIKCWVSCAGYHTTSEFVGRALCIICSSRCVVFFVIYKPLILWPLSTASSLPYQPPSVIILTLYLISFRFPNTSSLVYFQGFQNIVTGNRMLWHHLPSLLFYLIPIVTSKHQVGLDAAPLYNLLAFCV